MLISERSLAMVVALTVLGCGASPPRTVPAPARVHVVREMLLSDAEEDVWRAMASEEIARALLVIALDPGEADAMRVSAFVVLGEVFTMDPSELRSLICGEPHVDRAVILAALVAIEELDAREAASVNATRSIDAIRARRCAAPIDDLQFAPDVGVALFLAWGTGDRGDLVYDDEASLSALGLGASIHFGVRVGDLGVVLHAHGSAYATFADPQSGRSYVGVGPALLVAFRPRIDAQLRLSLAVGGGFDYGRAEAYAPLESRVARGVFPTIHTRFDVPLPGFPIAIGFAVECAIPVELPELFSVAAGFTVGVRAP